MLMYSVKFFIKYGTLFVLYFATCGCRVIIFTTGPDMEMPNALRGRGKGRGIPSSVN